MQHIIEKNERIDRRNALVIAISLHLALATLLYLYASDSPSATNVKPIQVKEKTTVPAPDARTVSTP